MPFSSGVPLWLAAGSILLFSSAAAAPAFFAAPTFGTARTAEYLLVGAGFAPAAGFALLPVADLLAMVLCVASTFLAPASCMLVLSLLSFASRAAGTLAAVVFAGAGPAFLAVVEALPGLCVAVGLEVAAAGRLAGALGPVFDTELLAG